MTETAERPVWPRLSLVAAAFVGAVALLALAVGAYTSRQDARLVAAIEEAEAELDQSDPNWRLEALLRMPEVPADQDSGPRILAVARGVPEGWPEHDGAPMWRGPGNRRLDAEQLAALDKALAPLKQG